MHSVCGELKEIHYDFVYQQRGPWNAVVSWQLPAQTMQTVEWTVRVQENILATIYQEKIKDNLSEAWCLWSNDLKNCFAGLVLPEPELRHTVLTVSDV